MTTQSFRRRLAAATLSCLLLGTAHATDAQKDAPTPAATPEATARDLDRIFRRSALQIATPDARLHRFNVWIADDDRRRARGLMFIRHLGPEDGMLFIYPRAHPVSMWMKNTYVPLDMLFVAADGRVTRVVENTEPLSLKTIESGEPVLAVVELAAGTAARLKIGPGARVMHPAFDAQR
jgi:uncharacterized membrane protein (UPF0127 family)